MTPPSPHLDASALARLGDSIARRAPLIAPEHDGAVRLLNGFAEGLSDFVLDVYGTTLVVFDHRAEPEPALPRALFEQARQVYPWLAVAVWKPRRARDKADAHGQVIAGERAALCDRIVEAGVPYALHLLLGNDASFYLDTRELRAWLKRECVGRRVLNTFAATGSLGVAARSAPAALVQHVDRSQAALDVARRSYGLSGWPVRRGDFISADFFEHTARLRKSSTLFDCVIVDAPFYSAGSRGSVDLLAGTERLAGKARPLVGHGGTLVIVNNALYLPGSELMSAVERLTASGHLSLREIIGVPADVSGALGGGVLQLPADPAPFAHPTKIVVLAVQRKDGRVA